MPKIKKLNGRPTTKKKKPLTDFQRHFASKRKTGTDIIEIGSEEVSFIESASMADVMELVKGIRFLVKDFIPFAMLTMILGCPGVGKSAFALYGIVRPIITGCDWFNGMRGSGKPGYVLWCDTEGSNAINAQRLQDWGIPPDRILVPFADDPLKPIDLTNPQHLERIEHLVNQFGILVVVIDSLRGSHKGDENSSRIADVLQNTSGIAERTNSAIIIIHHTRKIGIDEEISADSSRGSNAITAMVRSQLGIDRPDKDSDWCRLQMLKENLGLKPTPIGFQISSSGVEFGSSPEKPRKVKKETGSDKAEQWLQARMKPGEWYLANDIANEAEALGFSKTGTLQTARESLGIVKPDNVKKVSKHSEWRLPTPSPEEITESGDN